MNLTQRWRSPDATAGEESRLQRTGALNTESRLMIVPARRQAACAQDTRSISSTQGGKERLVGKGTTIK